MSCINIKNRDYQNLIKGLTTDERFIARIAIKKHFNVNNTDKFPNFITLKAIMSDMFSSNKAGIDYKEFYSEVKGVVKSLLPNLTEEEIETRVKFVDRLELMRLRGGKKVLSTFINNTIYLSTSLLTERGKKAYTDVRHEVFHMVFNNFLSEIEQEAILESFKRNNPAYANSLDKVELEEAISEEFENYRINKNRSVITALKNFFEDILNLFGLIRTGYKDINRLFEDLERGRFTRDFLKDSLVTRDKDVLFKYTQFKTDVDHFLQVKAFLLKNLSELMFPEGNTTANENKTPELFLTPTDSSIDLFNNNKDLFKIGLTREDALKKVQSIIKDLRASKILDENLKRVVETLSESYILKDMYDYLQPYSSATVTPEGELRVENKERVEEDITILEEQLGETAPDLQIHSKERIDPLVKISEAVKDFLSNITYQTSPGNYVNIDPGVGFVSLLNLLNGLSGNTSVKENLNSLEKNKANITGSQSLEVFNTLKALHEDIRDFNVLSLDLKGISEEKIGALEEALRKFGINTEVVKEKMAVRIPDTMKIENVGTNNIDNIVEFSYNGSVTGNKNTILNQKVGESNKSFIERISSETGIPVFIVAKLFLYNEQRNKLAEITKVAGSLRQLSPKFVKVLTESFLDEDESGKKVTTTSFLFINKISEETASLSVSSIIKDRLDSLPVREKFVKKIAEYVEASKKHKDNNFEKYAKKVLRELIVEDENESTLALMTPSEFLKLKDSNVKDILKGLVALVKFAPDLQGKKSTKDFSDYKSFHRKASALGEKISRSSTEKNVITSFKTSDSNKSKWMHQMVSSGWMVFKNLVDKSKIKDFKNLVPHLQNSFNNYYKFNPLLVHDYSTETFTVDSESLKIEDADFKVDFQETYFENEESDFSTFPIPFNRESTRNWINRNFVAMFQGVILESKSKSRTNFSYFQQELQPESAPNVGAVKMGVLPQSQIEERIMYMLIQEAFINHQNSSSASRKTLRINSQKSLLPGLGDSSYFIKNNKNIFFDSEGNLNPEFGSVVDGNLVIDKNNKTLQSLTGIILKDLGESLDLFTDLVVNEKATIEGTTLLEMYNKIKHAYSKTNLLTSEESLALGGLFINKYTKLQELKSSNDWGRVKAALNKVMSVYYLNSFVNGFFVSQLKSGATQNYSTPLNEIKRQATINAMKDVGLIDKTHGMKPTYRNVVITPMYRFYGENSIAKDVEALSRHFYNTKIELGDAQSWSIPEYKQDLRKSFGKSSNTGVVTKDQHQEVNKNGEVEIRKTSTAEITNELAKSSDTFKNLRFEMTFREYIESLPKEEKESVEGRLLFLYDKLIKNNGLKDNPDEYFEYKKHIQIATDKNLLIDVASFSSAIKGAKPSKLSSFVFDPKTKSFKLSLAKESVLTLTSSYNGIQQNVRHRYIDSFISHFTQLTYLIGLNRTETSIKSNQIITKSLAKINKAGVHNSMFDLRLSYDKEGGLKINQKNKSIFAKKMKKLLDQPGNDLLLDFLDTPNISMNNPLFSEKIIQTFFNSLSKDTVKPKHPGGSFVLKSSFGFDQEADPKKGKLKEPRLVRDNKGNVLYAECYLPEMYSYQLSADSLIYYNSDDYNKMFGYRIPSSDIHSSVPLKVIGYYPSPKSQRGEQSHDNIIVVPPEITALHGADFDVDKLFVVRYGVYLTPSVEEGGNKNNLSKNHFQSKFQPETITLAQKGIKIGYISKKATYDKDGNIKSLGGHTKVSDFEKILLSEKISTQKRILFLEGFMRDYDKETLNMRDKGGITKKEEIDRRLSRREISEELTSLKGHLNEIRKLQSGFHSNEILSAVLDAISYSGENKDDLLYGINFSPVKGYEPSSEYSKLAEIYSEINKLKGIKESAPKRPTLYTSLNDALNRLGEEEYEKYKKTIFESLAVDPSTPQGAKDFLTILNNELKEEWVEERDIFIKTQQIGIKRKPSETEESFKRRKNSAKIANLNKVEQHARIHKETYMAADLVGFMAQYSKGLSYLVHGITDGSNEIIVDVSEANEVNLDGEVYNVLTLENEESVKNQELRSLGLNAALDHVSEQILNTFNVSKKTAKIFCTAISTKMPFHKASMLMMQPSVKELSGSNTEKVTSRIDEMLSDIKLAVSNRFSVSETDGTLTGEGEFSSEEISSYKLATKNLEKNILSSFEELLEEGSREKLLEQYKVLLGVKGLHLVGEKISEVSKALSILQDLPYNLELSHEKLEEFKPLLNVEVLLDKAPASEDSEYSEELKKLLVKSKPFFKNVNLANNENILAALEAIRYKMDVTFEMFSEYSLQMQFVLQELLGGIEKSSSSRDGVLNDFKIDLSFDTIKNMKASQKYLKGSAAFNVTKFLSKNFLNFMTTGLNMSYNKDGHIFSLKVSDQNLKKVSFKDGGSYTLSPVGTYLDSFLMYESETKKDSGGYNGDAYAVSQINSAWRIKPLSVLKKENKNNKFLKGIGIGFNDSKKSKTLSFDSELLSSVENRAEIRIALDSLNSLKNVYVVWNEESKAWVDISEAEHPQTDEMNEIVFNIIKSSLYLDNFKFGSSKVTAAISPGYFVKIFRELETLTKDLILWREDENKNKYFKTFEDLNDKTNIKSVISQIVENLYINSLFSSPEVLPNVSKKYAFKNKNAGITSEGAYYDFIIDAKDVETLTAEKNKESEDTTSESLETAPKIETIEAEAEESKSETEAKEALFNKFKKNPTFIVDKSGKNKYEIFIKVGTSGSKDLNSLKYYYKKIGTTSSGTMSNSFNLNLLKNEYKIKDYFNPRMLSIPVPGGISGKNVSLKGIRTSSFMVYKKDNKNLKNLLENIKYVSLYNSATPDRVGLKKFTVLSVIPSEDNSTVDLELEAFEDRLQVHLDTFETPLILTKTLSDRNVSNEEKVKVINNTPGVSPILKSRGLTNAELNAEYSKALEAISQIKDNEILETIKDNLCNGSL